MMEADGFVLVKPKGKRRRNPAALRTDKNKNDPVSQEAIDVRTVVPAEVVIQRVNKERVQLQVSELLNNHTLKALATRFRCTSTEVGESSESDDQGNAAESHERSQSHESGISDVKIVNKIICLGLGSPSKSSSAVLQLAFVLLLRDRLKPTPQVDIFDPVLAESDKMLLRNEWGLNVLDANTQGKHKRSESLRAHPNQNKEQNLKHSSDNTEHMVDKSDNTAEQTDYLIQQSEHTTEQTEHIGKQSENIVNQTWDTTEKSEHVLFFMPHCSLQLYCNLLWANWGINDLSEISIIGNSFNGYDARIMDANTRNDESNCVLKLLPVLSEVRLFVQAAEIGIEFDDGGAMERAFNDTSLMFYTKEKLESVAGQALLQDIPPENHCVIEC